MEFCNILIFFFFIEPFRIKHRSGGFCWTASENNEVIVSSQCRDIFQLGRDTFPSNPFAVWHRAKRLRVYGRYRHPTKLIAGILSICNFYLKPKITYS